MAKNIKANIKNIFKCIKRRETAREAGGVLDDEEIKEKIKKDMEITKRLKAFFASVLTTKGIFLPEQTSSGKESEGPTPTEGAKDDILKCIHKLKCMKSLGPGGVCPGILKEL